MISFEYGWYVLLISFGIVTYFNDFFGVLLDLFLFGVSKLELSFASTKYYRRLVDVLGLDKISNTKQTDFCETLWFAVYDLPVFVVHIYEGSVLPCLDKPEYFSLLFSTISDFVEV